MAINLFDNHGNGEMPIELYIEKIADKETWHRETELYAGGL